MQNEKRPEVNQTLSALAAMTCALPGKPLLVFDEKGKATGELTEHGQELLLNQPVSSPGPFDDTSHNDIGDPPRDGELIR